MKVYLHDHSLNTLSFTYMIQNAELQERMGDLKEELQFLQQENVEEAHKRKAEEALKRIERWNLFSDAHDVQVCMLYYASSLFL